MQHTVTTYVGTSSLQRLKTDKHDLKRRVEILDEYFLTYLDHAKEKETEHSTYKINFNFKKIDGFKHCINKLNTQIQIINENNQN